MRAALPLWFVAVCTPLFTGCALLGLEKTQTPPKEPSVTQENQYLIRKAPATGLDVGQDQKSVLETLKEGEDERVALRKRVEALEAERKELLGKCKVFETERDREKALRLTATSERDETRKQGADRDARLLNLAIQKTQLEQDLLLVKIASLEREKSGAPPKGEQAPGPAAVPPSRPHAGPGVDR